MKLYTKMKKRIINLVTLKSKNKNFANIKRPISTKNIDFNKIVVSNKVSFGKKDLIGYKNAKTIDLYLYFS